MNAAETASPTKQKYPEHSMKPKLFKTITAASLGLLILIASKMTSIAAQDSGNHPSATATGNFSKRSIEGVWLVTLQQTSCDTGAPIREPGRGLMTFAEGGTLSETTAPSGPLPGPMLRSPGHGVWERRGGNEYAAVTVVQLLGIDGAYAGRSRIVSTFQLSDDSKEFTSTATFTIIAPNGSVLTGCSISTGTRIE